MPGGNGTYGPVGGLVQDESDGIADGRNINQPGGQLDEVSKANGQSFTVQSTSLGSEGDVGR